MGLDRIEEVLVMIPTLHFAFVCHHHSFAYSLGVLPYSPNWTMQPCGGTKEITNDLAQQCSNAIKAFGWRIIVLSTL